MNFKHQEMEANNTILDGKKYYVSHNYMALTKAGMEESTALVINGVFLILKGDHRRCFADLDGLEEVVDYFLKHLSEASIASEHKIAAGMCKDILKAGEGLRNVLGGTLYEKFKKEVLTFYDNIDSYGGIFSAE